MFFQQQKKNRLMNLLPTARRIEWLRLGWAESGPLIIIIVVVVVIVEKKNTFVFLFLSFGGKGGREGGNTHSRSRARVYVR